MEEGSGGVSEGGTILILSPELARRLGGEIFVIPIPSIGDDDTSGKYPPILLESFARLLPLLSIESKGEICVGIIGVGVEMA